MTYRMSLSALNVQDDTYKLEAPEEGKVYSLQIDTRKHGLQSRSFQLTARNLIFR